MSFYLCSALWATIRLTKFNMHEKILIGENNMKIEFTGEKVCYKLKSQIKKAVKLSLDQLKQNHKKIMLSISFVSEEEIKELNNRTRNIDKVTDVLSFPNFNMKAFETIDVLDENNYEGKYIFIGDMAICLVRANEQAKEFGHSLEKEVIKLVVHSTLHLMGFDHIEDSDYEVMNREEEKIASKLYTF